MQSIPAMISGSWVQPAPADYFSNLRSIPWYRPSAMEFVNYESLSCSNRTCSLYIDRSLRMDDTAVWAEAYFTPSSKLNRSLWGETPQHSDLEIKRNGGFFFLTSNHNCTCVFPAFYFGSNFSPFGKKKLFLKIVECRHFPLLVLTKRTNPHGTITGVGLHALSQL